MSDINRVALPLGRGCGVLWDRDTSSLSGWSPGPGPLSPGLCLSPPPSPTKPALPCTASPHTGVCVPDHSLQGQVMASRRERAERKTKASHKLPWEHEQEAEPPPPA